MLRGVLDDTRDARASFDRKKVVNAELEDLVVLVAHPLRTLTGSLQLCAVFRGR